MATDVTAFRFIFVALLIRLELFSDPRGRKRTNQQLKRKTSSAAQWRIFFGNLALIFGWDTTNGRFQYLKCFGVQTVCTWQRFWVFFLDLLQKITAAASCASGCIISYSKCLFTGSCFFVFFSRQSARLLLFAIF